MIDEVIPVLLELGNEGADLEVAVDPAADGHVVGHGQDLDAVRQGALTANVFL